VKVFPLAGVELSPLLQRSFIAIFLPALDDDDYDCGAITGMTMWQRKPKYSEKTCYSSALYTTNLIHNPELEPGPSRWEDKHLTV
jgi:hypothetical protein